MGRWFIYCEVDARVIYLDTVTFVVVKHDLQCFFSVCLVICKHHVKCLSDYCKIAICGHWFSHKMLSIYWKTYSRGNKTNYSRVIMNLNSEYSNVQIISHVSSINVWAFSVFFPRLCCYIKTKPFIVWRLNLSHF